MAALALMVQATASDAGKSLIVAGLARAFARRGLKVAPFKPQNMSNNAAVAVGGEIGRAQALQARAAGLEPRVDMNPVLLKPEGDGRSQLVVRGRPQGSVSARAYYRLKDRLLPEILASFRELARDVDLVLVEGAGSAAEVNLRAADVANMGFATRLGLPVVLVGDVERGGVIASLVGTMALLSAEERALVAGYIVNKFRGDPELFAEARRLISERTGLPCLGVVPWFGEAWRLPAEDVLGLEERARARSEARMVVAVPKLPRIANFDDLDPLAQEPQVALSLVPLERALPPDADLVLLPGSKAVVADLEALHSSGMHACIQAHRRRGGWVVGLCGGYQMLGRWVRDPLGLEGSSAEAPGLGLLAVETVLESDKRVRLRRGLSWLGVEVEGYEIHLGRSFGPGCMRPVVEGEDWRDGARSADDGIWGTYLHGIFANDAFRARFLARLGARAAIAYEAEVERTLDRLAAHLERHLDLDSLIRLAKPPRPSAPR